MRKCGQSVEDAHKEWLGFVHEKSREAGSLQRRHQQLKYPEYFCTEALSKWGEGNHAIMDETSPEHEGFQEYCGVKAYMCAQIPGAGFLGAVRWGIDMEAHSAKESEISPERLELAKGKVRRYFAETFGEEALKRAVKEKR